MSGTGRDTSCEAYDYIRDNGVLSIQQWRIYHHLFARGPLTIGECFAAIRFVGHNVNDNTRTRFGELRDMGVIRELDKRECKVTGRTVLTFDVTSNLPEHLPLVEAITIRVAVSAGTRVTFDRPPGALSFEVQSKRRKATPDEAKRLAMVQLEF